MSIRNDNATVGMIQNALRYLIPQLERTEYPAYKFYEQFIPIDPRQMPGVETITYQRITHYGIWVPLASNSNTVEKSDFTLEPVTYNTEYFQASFSYSQVELDRVAFANANQANGIILNLTEEKYNAVLESYKQLVDDIFLNGRPNNNMFGILTHPDVPRQVAAAPISFNASPDGNLAILNRAVTSIVTNSKEVETPDTLILPTSRFNILTQQRIGGDSDTTVLEHFLRTSPYIRSIDSSPRLEDNGFNGTSSMITYRRDKSKLCGIIPKPLTALPPQPVGQGFDVYCHAQMGGVHIKRPASVLITEGI